jgi:hypothetical protein
MVRKDLGTVVGRPCANARLALSMDGKVVQRYEGTLQVLGVSETRRRREGG